MAGLDYSYYRQQAARNLASVMRTSGDESSSLANSARRHFPKSHMEITLDNFYSSKVYTSGSSVLGSVNVVTKRDVSFDAVQIVLLGTTRTQVDGIGSPHDVTHTFLKMVMPISESQYPVPRVLESGQEYSFPFHFVIPPYLTVNACNHHVVGPHIRDQHVLLPPSIGHWNKNDMAPAMVNVEYTIKARIYRDDGTDGRTKVIEAVRLINVLPTSIEEPPLNIAKNDVFYKMSKSKSIRKNLLSAKQGRLTAEAVQPGAVFVQPDGRASSTTTAQVALTFEPVSADVQQPKITSVTGKVAAHTFYSSATIPRCPNLGDWNQQFSEKRGEYNTSVSLASVGASRTRWTQHLYPAQRRDSGYSSDNNLDEAVAPTANGLPGTERQSSSVRPKTKARSGSPYYYSTILQLPIQLPTERKTFVPTFHSCIASRVYIVHLSIAVSIGGSRTTVNLALPLQVVVDGGSVDAGLPSFETALQEAEADEYLRPRTISIPEQQYMENSVLPGYGM